MIEIKHVLPPNFKAIVSRFPGARNPNVIFSYAPYIYKLDRRPLPQELLDHETVHIERQIAIGVEVWWEKYLSDPQFVFDEELLAHRAEYQSLCRVSRQVGRRALKQVAQKLAAELYGRMCTVEIAMQLLTKG